MKRTIILAGLALLALTLGSCIFIEGDSDLISSRYFASSLRGTWESNDPSVYSGKLIIDYNSIKITGYDESQSQGSNDTKRPFRDFTRNTTLQGYSDESDGIKIYIKDRGSWQPGIVYQYYKSGTLLNSDHFLKFDFGGRSETLKKIIN